MMANLSIFIDDSGQLHPKYPFSNFFVYAGFWAFSGDVEAIEKKFKMIHRQIFHSQKETKASEMSKQIKKQISRRLLNAFPNEFNPIFESVYVPLLDQVDFDNKQAVQLHKNYLILRLVEKAIREKRLKYPDQEINEVDVFVDNQSQTTLRNFDSIERYLNHRMHDEYKYSSFVVSAKPFKATFKDSANTPAIQICDVLANSKYEYHNRRFTKFRELMQEKGVNPPLKLPRYWETSTCK